MVVKFYWMFLLVFTMLSCSTKDVSKTYFENGTLESEIEIVDGKKEGIQKLYFDNGELQAEVEWENGLQSGLSKFYYRNGNLKSEAVWNNGVLNGFVKNYYESGGLQNEGVYKNNVQIGLFTLYYETGIVLQTTFYKDGMRVGLQTVYNENGTKSSEKTFLNIKGKERLTGVISYDAEGLQVDESVRVSIVVDSSTFELNNKISLELRLIKPHFDSTRFIIGDFNNTFTEVDTVSLVTLNAKNHAGIIQVSANEVLRGYADNFQIIEQSKDTLTSKHSYIYFEFPMNQ